MTDHFNFSPSPRLTKALIICLFALLNACAEDDPKKYIQEGTALFDKGDLDGARVQFKNALQVNSKMVEAYYGLALIEEKGSNWGEESKYLQEVVALDPNNVEAQVKLGYLQLAEIGKAKERVAVALKLAPENSDAILLAGRINLEQGNHEEALKQAEKVLVKEPGNPKALWLQAYVLMVNKQYDQAIAALDQGLAKSPVNLELGTLKVRLHQELAQGDKVIQDYEYLIGQHPDDKKIRAAQVNAYIGNRNFAEAEAALFKMIEKFPDDTDIKIELVKFMTSKGDFERAEQQLKLFITQLPKEMRLKNRLAQLYLARKLMPQAKSVLNEIVSADPTGKSGLDAKNQLAEIAVEENDKVGAEKLVDEVLATDSGNVGAMLLKAGFKLEHDDVDGAVANLRIVLRDRPDSDLALVMMGLVHSKKNELENAESAWRQAIDANPGNVKANILLTDSLLKRGEADRAKDILTKSVRAKPENLLLRELLVNVLIAKQEWSAADASINEMEKQADGASKAKRMKALLAAKQGRIDDAIRAYQAILQDQPDANDALYALAKTYAAAGRNSEYRVYLQQLVKHPSHNVQVYNELGRLYALEKHWQDAEAILHKALGLNEQSVSTYKILAGVLLAQGKADDATALYQTGLANNPNSQALKLELAKHLSSIKQTQAAMTAYAEILNKYPELDEAANNLADLLLNASIDAADWQHALSLTERFKDSPNPFFMDTYGWALFKSGNAYAAADMFKKAIARMPDNTEFHYHLGEAYFAAGDKAAAKQELEKSLSHAGKQSEFAGIDRARELLKRATG